MRDAERRMGIALVEQHGRIVRLTPAGRYLAEASLSIEQQLLDAEVVAGLIDNGRRPRISAAIDFYDTAPWIVDLIGDAVSVEVVRVPVDGAVAALRRRVVELAVIPVSIIPTGISTTHLCDDHLVAVVPSASPLASAPRPRRRRDVTAPVPRGWTRPATRLRVPRAVRTDRARSTRHRQDRVAPHNPGRRGQR